VAALSRARLPFVHAIAAARAGSIVAALALGSLLPVGAAAQSYPWQKLEVVGDSTGLIGTMVVSVSVEGDFVSATIDERHHNGVAISLTMSARLSDLNLDVAQARESMRSIHPHVGVLAFRCRGGARCVTYSTASDSFFEFPGPVVFGFFVRDRALAEQALADLRRIAAGGR
jgi:hypothetical protein